MPFLVDLRCESHMVKGWECVVGVPTHSTETVQACSVCEWVCIVVEQNHTPENNMPNRLAWLLHANVPGYFSTDQHWLGTMGLELNEKQTFHIEKKIQHYFALTLHHHGLLWWWGAAMFPLLALSFSFWLVVMAPRFITCHSAIQEIDLSRYWRRCCVNNPIQRHLWLFVKLCGTPTVHSVFYNAVSS